MGQRTLKLVYCTPALYMAGGVERVLTLKANYFAERFGYDITIVLTDGKDQPLFYPLSGKIKVINFDIGFEELWTCSFLKKIFLYLRKQYRYRRQLTSLLMELRPDITISLLRREINFITNIKDGSKKIGELHVNRANYRNFEANETNLPKKLFSWFWMHGLVSHLRHIDKFVVLTEEEKCAWPELDNVVSIPDPLSFTPTGISSLSEKRVIAVGRYVYQKGFDLLLRAWAMLEDKMPDWTLAIYGQGNREPYESLLEELGINPARCILNGPTADIQKEYQQSSILVSSSRFEGFGMVLVEAMSCGVPVISFDCSCGLKDIITNEEDGLLVKNGNVRELADAILRVASDADLRKKLQSNALANVKRFEIDNVSVRWKELFEAL